MKLNKYQKHVLRFYVEGENAHLADKDELTDRDITLLGDTLLQFVLIELSDTEDCDSQEEAVNRIDRALSDLEKLRATFDGVPLDANEEASCRTCGVPYNGAGDGWDDECADCADKTEAAREMVCASCGDKFKEVDSPDGNRCPDCHAKEEEGV